MISAFLRLLLVAVLIVGSLALVGAILDRFWGTSNYGGRVRPRIVPVYETRPRWVRTHGPVLVITASLTVLPAIFLILLVPEVSLEVLWNLWPLWLGCAFISLFIWWAERTDEVSLEP